MARRPDHRRLSIGKLFLLIAPIACHHWVEAGEVSQAVAIERERRAGLVRARLPETDLQIRRAAMDPAPRVPSETKPFRAG